jgi:hypothetical protein
MIVALVHLVVLRNDVTNLQKRVADLEWITSDTRVRLLEIEKKR